MKPYVLVETPKAANAVEFYKEAFRVGEKLRQSKGTANVKAVAIDLGKVTNRESKAEEKGENQIVITQSPISSDALDH